MNYFKFKILNYFIPLEFFKNIFITLINDVLRNCLIFTGIQLKQIIIFKMKRLIYKLFYHTIGIVFIKHNAIYLQLSIVTFTIFIQAFQRINILCLLILYIIIKIRNKFFYFICCFFYIFFLYGFFLQYTIFCC